MQARALSTALAVACCTFVLLQAAQTGELEAVNTCSEFHEDRDSAWLSCAELPGETPLTWDGWTWRCNAPSTLVKHDCGHFKRPVNLLGEGNPWDAMLVAGFESSAAEGKALCDGDHSAYCDDGYSPVAFANYTSPIAATTNHAAIELSRWKCVCDTCPEEGTCTHKCTRTTSEAPQGLADVMRYYQFRAVHCGDPAALTASMKSGTIAKIQELFSEHASDRKSDMDGVVAEEQQDRRLGSGATSDVHACQSDLSQCTNFAIGSGCVSLSYSQMSALLEYGTGMNLVDYMKLKADNMSLPEGCVENAKPRPNWSPAITTDDRKLFVYGVPPRESEIRVLGVKPDEVGFVAATTLQFSGHTPGACKPCPGSLGLAIAGAAVSRRCGCRESCVCGDNIHSLSFRARAAMGVSLCSDGSVHGVSSLQPIDHIPDTACGGELTYPAIDTAFRDAVAAARFALVTARATSDDAACEAGDNWDGPNCLNSLMPNTDLGLTAQCYLVDIDSASDLTRCRFMTDGPYAGDMHTWDQADTDFCKDGQVDQGKCTMRVCNPSLKVKCPAVVGGCGPECPETLTMSWNRPSGGRATAHYSGLPSNSWGCWDWDTGSGNGPSSAVLPRGCDNVNDF